MAKKKKSVKTKKSVKKTGGKKSGQVCGKCIFYVPNKDVKKIGACFQVSGQVKENQPAKCKGKFFKPKKAQ